MNEKIEIGVVGVRNMGATRRAQIRNSGAFTIAGTFDINKEWNKQAAGEENAIACGSLEQMLAMPDIEAVCLATPIPRHAPDALAAIKAGKHVFVDKPIAQNVFLAHEMVQAARQAGLVLNVGHMDYDSSNIYTQAYEYVKSGQLGAVCAVSVVCASSGGLHQKPDDWRADANENPGGPLLQCGIHSIHALEHFFGPIHSVCSFMRQGITSTGVDDVTETILRFEDGLVGSISSYYTTAYRHEFNIYGTEANIYCRTYEHEMYLQKRSAVGAEEPWETLPLPATFSDLGQATGRMTEFAQAIRGQMTGNCSDGLSALAVVGAAHHSDRKQCVVEVKEFLRSKLENNRE